jgi:hypothetical protein
MVERGGKTPLRVSRFTHFEATCGPGDIVALAGGGGLGLFAKVENAVWPVR